MTGSLKSLLEGKPRRRSVYLAEVADTTVAEAALRQARQQVALLSLTTDPAPETVAAAQAALVQAEADWDACFIKVEFQALPDLDMERLFSAHLNKDGVADQHALAPVLAAACAVDEELRDADWWASLLASEAWSQGETSGLYQHLLNLNWRPPAEGIPKG